MALTDKFVIRAEPAGTAVPIGAAISQERVRGAEGGEGWGRRRWGRQGRWDGELRMCFLMLYFVCDWVSCNACEEMKFAAVFVGLTRTSRGRRPDSLPAPARACNDVGGPGNEEHVGAFFLTM